MEKEESGNSKLVIKWQAKNYFFKYLKSNKVKPIYQTENFKKLNHYLNDVGIDKIRLGKWSKLLNKINTVIIFDSMVSDTAISKIRQINNNIKIYMYFWNAINENNKHLLSNYQIDKFYTFDDGDAKEYNMNYNPQFYTKKVKLRKRKIKYDVCFVGRDKKRAQTINKVKKKLIENGITFDIRVMNDERNVISYSKYLSMISKSKCILDIVANNQQGLSLRVMESIFLKKKLITNNKNVKNYDFYNKDNIFIIGIDNWNKISKFINDSYAEISKEIVEKYDFEDWINRFK